MKRFSRSIWADSNASDDLDLLEPELRKWLRTQPVNRVLALTLTVELYQKLSWRKDSLVAHICEFTNCAES